MLKKINVLDEDYKGDIFSAKLIDYEELKTNTENWFRHLSTDELNFEDFISDKLIELSELSKNLGIKIHEGIESRKGGKVQVLTISQSNRAIKKSDIFVIQKEGKNKIIAKNKISGDTINIPKKVLKHALRRISLINKINVSNFLDYVIVDSFKEEDDYFRMDLVKGKPKDWGVWRKYVEDRMAHLALLRRANLSAPSTCAIAFFSSTLMAPPGVAWTMKIDNEDVAKILCLWFNSTLNLLQILSERKETEGAFMQVDKYVLNDFLVINPEKLTENEKESLLKTFEEVKDVELPSILTQLKDKHPIRKKIDKAFLKILGKDIDLDILYEKVANEIEVLKKIMSEGR